MAKKKNRGGGQQPNNKPAEEGDDKAVGDDRRDEASCDKQDKADGKGKDQDKGNKEKADSKGKDKADDKGTKKAPPPLPVVTAVLKVDMHCDGCAKRIRASVRHYPGVEGVAMDVPKGTMTVVGRFDAKKLRDRVARKTKKKVDLVVGSQTAKAKDDGENKKQGGGDFKVHEYGKPDYMSDLYWLDRAYGWGWKPTDTSKDGDKGSGGGGGGGGGGKGKEDKGSGGGGGGGGKGNKEDKGSGGGGERKDKQDDKGSGEGKGKQDDKKQSGGGGDKGNKGGGGKDNKKPAVPIVATVVLKIGAMGLHCDGCMNRVRAKVFKIKGVEQVVMDMAKNQVTVTGTMDAKGLPGTLQKKVRRPVTVVPAKDKQQDPGGSKEGGKDKDGTKQDGGGKDGKDKDAATKALTAEMQYWKAAFYDQHALLHTEFMLSDENPNACSVM